MVASVFKISSCVVQKKGSHTCHTHSLTRIKSVWYVDSIKTDTCCSAKGAITDLAILVTPTACELLEAFPLETTLSGSQVDPSTCRCSDGCSSGVRNRCEDGLRGQVCDIRSFPVRFQNRNIFARETIRDFYFTKYKMYMHYDIHLLRIRHEPKEHNRKSNADSINTLTVGL